MNTRPDWFATVPSFPGVTVYFQGNRGDEDQLLCFQYCGKSEDLISAGVATADMLRMNARTGRRHKRVDEDGDRYQLTRIWRTTSDSGQECPPYPYFHLRRHKRADLIAHLPAAREAMAAYHRYLAWDERQSAERYRNLEIRKQQRVHLRIVVDNTRGP